LIYLNRIKRYFHFFEKYFRITASVSNSLAGLEKDPVFCDSFDVHSYDISLAMTERFVEIPIGTKTKALLSGSIGWLEKRLVRDVGRKLLV